MKKPTAAVTATAMPATPLPEVKSIDQNSFAHMIAKKYNLKLSDVIAFKSFSAKHSGKISYRSRLSTNEFDIFFFFTKKACLSDILTKTGKETDETT